jgi:hypothetical protein
MNINVIPYSYIASNIIEQYITQNKESFIKENDSYFLVRPFTTNKMNLLIKNAISSTIPKMHSDVTYIIGDCYYYNSWRMHLEHDLIKPEWREYINNKMPIKYVLKEKDIKIDELKFNHILDSYFIKYFRKAASSLKFIKHRNLTEDDIIFVFNKMFSSNILNIIKNEHSSIEKINDLIFSTKSDQLCEKHINNVSSIIDSQMTSIL